MDSVSLSGKPDDVDDEGEGDPKGVADEDAEEERLPFAVEGDAANFEEDRLDAPDEEDGEEGELAVQVEAMGKPMGWRGHQGNR